jgi:HD-GYP domain-containing protein (c-di-GMP phosphodiesterase class II)
MTNKARLAVLAGGYAVMGLATIGMLAAFGPSLPQDPALLATLGLFACSAAVLSYRSAEVNDRLFASSTLMVTFSAGISLALLSGGSTGYVSAALPMALIGAASFLSSADISGRRVLLPLVNFGQAVTTLASGGLVIDLVMGALGVGWLSSQQVDLLEAPVSQTPSGMLIAVIVAALLGAAVATVVNLALVRTAVRVLYRSAHLVPWSGTARMMVTQVVQGVIGALLGFVIAIAPSISLIPLVLMMFIIGHMAFTSHATLRATHEAMLRGFVKILEARDLYTRGHTERVAEFSLAIGRELGFSEGQLARMRFAALIHDVGKLAVPTAIMRKQGALTDDEYREMRISTHKVDDLLSEVDFLAPMVVICSGVHPKLTVEDFGQKGHSHSQEATPEQSVLGVADAFDAMTSTRSYRMAMSQSVALGRLRASNDPLFRPEVVAALGKALSRMSGSYGPPELSHNIGAPPGEVMRA